MCMVFFFLAVNVMITWFVLKLQSLSQILKHLCDFPLPQCWFGYYSRLSAPKYVWLNIGEGEGHIWVRTRVSGVNVRNLEKIQDKWLLFQRFVTSIVFSWKRRNNDRFRSRWIFWDRWWKICVFFFFSCTQSKIKKKNSMLNYFSCMTEWQMEVRHLKYICNI